MVQLVGITDNSGQYASRQIEEGLRQFTSQTVERKLFYVINFKYFPEIETIMIYGYPDTFARAIPLALRDIKSELPHFQPVYVGFGDENHIHDGQMVAVNKGTPLDKMVEKLIQNYSAGTA